MYVLTHTTTSTFSQSFPISPPLFSLFHSTCPLQALSLTPLHLLSPHTQKHNTLHALTFLSRLVNLLFQSYTSTTTPFLYSNPSLYLHPLFSSCLHVSPGISHVYIPFFLLSLSLSYSLLSLSVCPTYSTTAPSSFFLFLS